MSGFSNPIIGGGGALVYPSIHSPNFDLSPFTGWSIDKNGNAYFANITAEGTITASTFDGTDFIINQTGAYFYSGTPASGNLIASITNANGTDPFGNTVYGGLTTYDEATGQIAQMFLGQLLLFAPTVGSGSGNQSDFYSQQNAVFSGTGGATFLFGGGEGSNGLATIALYDSGAGGGVPVVAARGSALALTNPGGTPPTPPVGVVTMYELNGFLRLVATDSNSYSVGHLTQFSSTAQTINSTSEAALTALTFPVVAGTYRVRGVVTGTNGGTVATQAVGIDGPAASHVRVNVTITSATANSFKAFGQITSLSGRVGTASLSASETFAATYDGLITFTAAGTLEITGSCVTSASDTWSAAVFSYMTLEPV